MITHVYTLRNTGSCNTKTVHILHVVIFHSPKKLPHSIQQLNIFIKIFLDNIYLLLILKIIKTNHKELSIL